LDYVIHKNEYSNLVEKGIVSMRLVRYLEDIQKRLSCILREEIENKSFTLKNHPVLTNDNINYSYNLNFVVESATEELTKALEQPENIVICMVDPV